MLRLLRCAAAALKPLVAASPAEMLPIRFNVTPTPAQLVSLVKINAFPKKSRVCWLSLRLRIEAMDSELLKISKK